MQATQSPAADARPTSVHLPHVRVVGPDPSRTMPHRIANHPLTLSILGALARPTELGWVAWLVGAAGGVLTAASEDVFTGIYLLTGIACLLDLRWGALVAHHERRYDAERKRRGRDQKIIALTLLLMFRAAEYWAASAGLLPVEQVLRALGIVQLASTNAGGVISAAICAGVLWDELQSWEAHRRTLGGRTIVLISRALSLGRVAQARTATAAAVAADPGAQQ